MSQRLTLPLSREDAVALQDGLHNLIQTPDFQQVMNVAVASYLGPVFEPELVELLRRFLSPGDRNDARSYKVPDVANGGPIKIAERDSSRAFIMLSNLGAATVFVGGRQVTTGVANDPSGGIPVPANNYPPLLIEADIGELWAISANNGMDLRVLDVSGGI